MAFTDRLLLENDFKLLKEDDFKLLLESSVEVEDEDVVTGHGGQKKEKKKPQPYPFDKDWSVEVDRPEAPAVEVVESVPIEERRRAVPPVAVEQLAEHNAKLEFELSGIRTIEAQLRQSLELKRKRDQQERDDEEALFRLGVFD